MTSFSKGQKGGSKAWAISDRSGVRFPMHEMVREPGTGYLVHRSESDGRYNFVDHPQAHINEYATFGDPFPVADARPDIVWASTASTELVDQNGSILLAGYVSFYVMNVELIHDFYDVVT